MAIDVTEQEKSVLNYEEWRDKNLDKIQGMINDADDLDTFINILMDKLLKFAYEEGNVKENTDE